MDIREKSKELLALVEFEQDYFEAGNRPFIRLSEALEAFDAAALRLTEAVQDTAELDADEIAETVGEAVEEYHQAKAELKEAFEDALNEYDNLEDEDPEELPPAE